MTAIIHAIEELSIWIGRAFGMNEMGLSVVQLPGGEIQPAMKSGLIDAAEFNNPTSDSDFGMQDVSKHYHLASFHQSQECFEVTFNAKKFNSLSKELQAMALTRST